MSKIATGAYVIVRTQNAGVFAGTLAKKDGDATTLTGARRIWYWAGAASLSELAMKGTAKPKECKFPAPVDEVELRQTIETLAVTEDAQKSIEEVPIWTQR